MRNLNKIFIVGLPRTGTTSVCKALLDLDISVAHTAYTQEAFRQAKVIADTPVYCDYPFLDKLFPNSVYILLERELESWLPSVRGLLAKFEGKLGSQDKGFNPILQRCIGEVFVAEDELSNIDYDDLTAIYQHHQKQIQYFFKERSEDLLCINISVAGSYARLLEFLEVRNASACEFPLLNSQGRIADWDKIKHPMKVSSHARGPEGRKYFDWSSS